MAVFFCLFFILGGLFRAQGVMMSENKLAEILKCENQKVIFEGVVNKEPEIIALVLEFQQFVPCPLGPSGNILG